MKKHLTGALPAIGLAMLTALLLPGCNERMPEQGEAEAPQEVTMEGRVNMFKVVPLQADISHLTEKERQMVVYMVRTAQIMDDLFWYEAYGDKEGLLDTLKDPWMKDFATIHYGPWDRLNNNAPFIPGVGEKPEGANFYPVDMTREEYNALKDPAKGSMYTLLRRDESGKLIVIPYHEAFAEQIAQAAANLDSAAQLCEDAGLKRYLTLRAEALRTDDYRASDMAWMEMRSNRLDFIVGPIENYEDHLYGTKAAHEAFVLIKDMEWSQRLAHYGTLLPKLQQGLPVAEEYKKEKPALDSDLGVYDAVYYAGDCNAGSKTIAINLPNDEVVQLEKGSRKLQLRNAIGYKFNLMMKPIAELLIDTAQLAHVSEKAFFENTLFHEVAHGLGIKNRIDGSGTVREGLLETYSAIEEGKADILGIHMIEQLISMGELEGDIMDYYVTFMAGIFRSIRFGGASAHGKANTVRFHYFQDQGAFTRNPTTGRYTIHREQMAAAVKSLSQEILILQGNGDYAAAKRMLESMGEVDEALKQDLMRIEAANIPVDLRFEQGLEVLGLTKE